MYVDKARQKIIRIQHVLGIRITMIAVKGGHIVIKTFQFLNGGSLKGTVKEK